MLQLPIDGFFIHPLEHDNHVETPMHSHLTGQLFFLNSGMISCAAENKRWSITPNGIGWIPAKMVHCAKSWGKVSAWSLHLPDNLCRHFPAEPCILQTNVLINALFARVITFYDSTHFTDEQLRMLLVLLDEVKNSQQINSLLLPSPRHSRLVNITQAIWQDPSISKTQDQWASSIGMSVRSFSRHFIKETGITFSHWRQLAKLLVSLEKLSQGLPINEIAYDVGFTDASAYIAAFKAVFGVTPRRYFGK